MSLNVSRQQPIRVDRTISMTNPYAPPQATVRDIADPSAAIVPADRGTRLGAMLLDGIIGGAMVYLPLLIGVLAGGATANVSPGSGIGAVSSGFTVIGFVLGLAGFVTWAWLTIVNVKRTGQTLGKK